MNHLLEEIVAAVAAVEDAKENLSDAKMNLVGAEVTYNGHWAMIDTVQPYDETVVLYVEERGEDGACYDVCVDFDELSELL